MSKTVEIKRCNDCPHMDNIYYEYLGECSLLDDRAICNEIDIYNEIHSECPLKDWSEDE